MEMGGGPSLDIMALGCAQGWFGAGGADLGWERRWRTPNCPPGWVRGVWGVPGCCRVAPGGGGRRRGNFSFLPAATQLLLPLPHHEQMEKALANLALRSAEAGAGEPMVSKAPSPASTSSALKGVSQELLERVSNSILAPKY